MMLNLGFQGLVVRDLRLSGAVQHNNLLLTVYPVTLAQRPA